MSKAKKTPVARSLRKRVLNPASPKIAEAFNLYDVLTAKEAQATFSLLVPSDILGVMSAAKPTIDPKHWQAHYAPLVPVFVRLARRLETYDTEALAAWELELTA